ncbi:MAG: hypothetical protein MUE60_02510 [Candidatus Eisenbacteria bacterium]|nr:hypothetical protein [Candidatus Eisenbacteria bacterium]
MSRRQVRSRAAIATLLLALCLATTGISPARADGTSDKDDDPSPGRLPVVTWSMVHAWELCLVL